MASVFKINSFINGKYVKSNDYMDSIDPATLEKIADIGLCTENQVLDAVEAAKTAFSMWSALSVNCRSKHLLKLADLIERDIEEFAMLESRDQGKTLKQAKEIEMPRALINLRSFAISATLMEEKATEQSDQSTINIRTRDPIGVAAIITPWNLPLYLLTFKLAPCLIFGNTCICKPSEFTSLTAWKLSQLIVEAGFPPGVVNIVFGEGKTIGFPLTNHPDVKLVTFTGSTVTGKIIQENCAGSFKKLSLEMGGKNAAVVCNDVDIENAVDSCITSSFLNQGEICLCTSRIFVHEDIYSEFVNLFVEKAKKLKVGDPRKFETFMGPLNNKMHYEKVKGYLDNAKGKLLCGYGIDQLDLPNNMKNGYFILPTVITNVTDEDPVMVDEIFGPVTAIVSFKTLDEVVQRVNSSKYGLCAVVHAKDQQKSLFLAKHIQVGTLWINCWLVRDLRMPFGGCKMSGLGREGLEDSREFYTEVKTICLKY